MASFSGTAYHADSDADDEFERSVMASPTHLHTDESDQDMSSEPPSNEHTPTTFGTPFDDGIRPRNVISEWSAEECAQFVASLGLRQYSEQFMQDDIVGEALIALGHEELKELGVHSAGHRLKILKEVYTIKIRQDVPVDDDHYTPPCKFEFWIQSLVLTCLQQLRPCRNTRRLRRTISSNSRMRYSGYETIA